MSIYEKLLRVQMGLKAPKSQWNIFGKYYYRNCEDILEAAKPLLEKEKLLLRLHDEIVQIGERYYIKATARIIDIEDLNTHDVTAYAREEESKKGMDGSQVTGASSSYARKYALNGLFLIDDTKDSDATNNNNKGENKPTESKSGTLSDAQIKRLYSIATKAGLNADLVKAQVKKVFDKEVKDLTKAEYDKVCNGYENKAKEKENE